MDKTAYEAAKEAIKSRILEQKDGSNELFIAFAIEEILPDVRDELVNRFVKKVENAVKKQYGNIKYTNRIGANQYSCCFWILPDWCNRWKEIVGVGIHFDGKNYESGALGVFGRKSKSDNPLTENDYSELQHKIRECEDVQKLNTVKPDTFSKSSYFPFYSEPKCLSGLAEGFSLLAGIDQLSSYDSGEMTLDEAFAEDVIILIGEVDKVYRRLAAKEG